MLKSHRIFSLVCTLRNIKLSNITQQVRMCVDHNSADIPLFWPHHHLQVFRLPLPHPLTTSWLCAAHLDHCGVCPLQRDVCTKAYLLVDLCCTQMVSPPLHHLTALPKLQSRLGRKEIDTGQHHLWKWHCQSTIVSSYMLKPTSHALLTWSHSQHQAQSEGATLFVI